MVAHPCNLSTLEVKAGGSEVQEYLQLHNEFKASLSDMRHYVKKGEGEKKKKNLNRVFVRQYLAFNEVTCS